MPSLTETIPTYKATLTADIQSTLLVAITKHIEHLQQSALAAKGLGLWDNEQYFKREALVAVAGYNAILGAE